ncbi:MAG TPA: phosphoribosylformylglycinamidine cyclo-ligase [Firmicutes bacterium]|nr:phosphoribosylformylglycinamidine cyclo-ligase [Bacillota bacterium]
MKNKFSYKKAGVDIDAAAAALKKAKKDIKSTFNPNVMTDLGSFGGVYRISPDKMLVSSTDGVGTKIKIAQKLGLHTGVGMDIVNHCVNDILVMGARPLFFLDYIGIGKITGNIIPEIISGIARACRENNCVLIGGETAEMPDVYAAGEYDLVGTITGEINNNRVITGKKIRPGDTLLGLASAGLHTNGYTLARRVLESKKISYTKKIKGLKTTPGEAMLAPHKSYFNSVYPAIQKFYPHIKGLAHITGGGFYDNMPRVLPPGTGCVINKNSWKTPAIFRLIQETGGISEREMYRVFNMGIGMVIAVSPGKKSSVKKFLEKQKEKVYEIGQIVKDSKKTVLLK